MKTIIQIGLKRSGNHGIINLLKQAYTWDNIVHLNDVVHNLFIRDKDTQN